MLRRWTLLALAALLCLAAPAGAAETPSQQAARLSATIVQHVQVAEALQRAARTRARRAEARELGRTSRTVRGALRRAWLLGVLDRAHHDRYRSALHQARRTAERLPPRRRAELTAAIRAVEDLARRRKLTPTRLRPAFLVLERNAQQWRTRPFPRPGQRVTFGSDPAVFEHRPGQGLVLHPLASWGRVNGVARACLATPSRCPRTKLRRDLDRLAGLASRRGGGLAWEYLHRYGKGRPPWVSGMAQGTAVQALARGAAALDRRAYLRTARRGLGVFEQRPPLGVAVPGPAGGTHFAMYSFDPGLRILNGFLQSITGLRDLATLGGSTRARALYLQGERAARAEVGRADTGAWSLYSAKGREANLNYHVLTRGFLRNLCLRTHRGAYCGAERRFARYEREPPRIGVVPVRAARAGRTTTIAFRLSKVSSVDVRVGGVVLARKLLPRGRHALSWTPPRRGAYRVQVAATGLSGPRGTATETVRVKPRPLTPAQRRAARAKARAAERAARRAARRR